MQRFLWHILAVVLTLVPGSSVGEVHSGDSYFFNRYAGNSTDSNTVTGKATRSNTGRSSRNVSADTAAEKEKQADPNGGEIADRKNKVAEIAKTSVKQVAADALQTLPQDQDQQFNSRQALQELERKLDYRMRVAATNFANNSAQGFVQQSLPQILFGQHWLAEKFQYLSTLSWQTGDDEGGILGELDLVVPLYGARNGSGVDQYGWFLQPGLVSWEADNGYRRLDVNIGLVHRRLLREDIAVGASVFYDHNIDTDLSRFGVGADWVSPYTYFSANYYQPLNGWRNGERLGYEERALRGFDVNVEQALWDSHWVLEASAGYWEGYDAEQREADWEPSGSVGVRFYPWHHLSLYADYAYHHDHVDTDRFAVGIEFSYPGKNRSVSTNEIDLWRPVKREKRILYAEREIFPARIGVSSSSNTIDINGSEFSPEQLQLTVTLDRALAANLDIRFGLLVNDIEVMPAAERLKNGGQETILRGQTQVVITYNRDDLERLFRLNSVAENQIYTLRVIEASLGGKKIPLPGGNADRQVKITVGEVTSQLQIAALRTEAFRAQNQELVRNGDVQLGLSLCPEGANDIQCFRIRRPLGGMSDLNIPIRPRAFNGNSLTARFSTNSTAVAGSDYNLQTPSLTWTAAEAETYQNIRVEILPSNPGDEEVEYFRILTDIQIDGEDVEFPGCTARDGRQTDACIRVELTRPPTLSLASDPADTAGGGEISLVVTSDIDVAGTLMLPLTISGDVVAADFTNGLTQTVSANFNGGKTATVIIATVKDTDAAEDYTITLGASAGGANDYMVGNDAMASGTITMAVPILTLATDPSTVVAGNDISLTVTSDIAVAGTLTVPLTISDRAASGITAGDFTDGLMQSVSVNFAGTTTATVTLGTVRDGDTAAETYRIMLGNGAGYTAGRDRTAAGAINPIPPTLTLADNPNAVVAGNNISLTITSDINVAGSLDLPLTFSGQVAAADFNPASLTQSVRANFNGGSTAMVSIATVKDADADETYTITLDAATSGSNYAVGSDNTATGTIRMAMPALTLVNDPAAVVAGNAISLTITSDITVAGTLTVPLRISGQVAASDFTGNTLTPSVSANFAGNRTATVTIATAEDGDADETYTITLATGGTGYTLGDDTTATGRITAITPTLTLATVPAGVQAGEDISLVVTSDVAVTATLRLSLVISAGAGSPTVVADDFPGGLNQSVDANFNGSTTATVLIATTKDGDPTESYTITLGTGSGYMVGSQDSVSNVILRLPPTLSLADPDAVVAGNDISLTVTSDIAVAGTLMLSLTIADRASSGIDANDFSGGLTQTVSASFNGSTTATVTIGTEKDGDTATETYIITLGSSGQDYTIGSPATANGAITAAMPILTLEDDPADAVAGSDISLTITSDVAITGMLTLALTFDGQVTAADLNGNTLTQMVDADFGGTTSATVTITTVKDGDSAETYTITLGTGSNYAVGGDNTAAGTITAATPELTLESNPAAVVAGENISLTITSDIAVAGTLMVPLTFGGQVVAADLNGNTLTQMVDADFGDGKTATVLIGTEKDGDPAETYMITLGGGSGYTVGSNRTASGTINAATPELTLVDDPADVVAGTNISLTITSDIDVAGNLTIPLTFMGQVSAADLNPNTLSQSVTANFSGGKTATVTIGTLKDGDLAETYTITLGSGAGYTVGGDNTAAGEITAATPELTLEDDPGTVSAGNGISLVVTSDISITRTLTLALGISGDVVASDITGGLTQNVTANFSGRTATVTIGTARDGDSSAEDYTITLNAGTGYTVGTDPGDNTATGTINVAAATTPTLTLATNPANVAAGEDISLMITSDIAVAGVLMVPLTIADRASSGIDADDFTGALMQTVSANFNNTTTATVMIGTVKDGDSAETYTITLGMGTGYTRGSPNAVDGTITAATPELMLATNPADVAAGEDISLTITSDIDVASTLTVPLTFSGEVAAADIDGGSPQMVSANFNSSTTATVTIGTVRDGDADETYTIMLGSGAGYTVGSPNSVNGTITAATPELTLENNPVAVTAGNDISLVVTSDISITRTLTLALGISGDVVASDITGGLTQNVTANFSGMTATVTIGTDMDSDSSAEDYTITLNAGTGYTVGTDPGDNTATGTINAAAATTPTLTLATNPADVAAGEDISLAITSDTVIASTLTVALTLGDEVAAEDITGGLSQMISANFNGTTSATVTIGTRKDNDAEEDYTITLATGTGYTVGSPNAVSGTITAVIPELTLATNPANVAAGEDISLAITSDTVIASTLTLPLTFSGEVAAEDITGGLSQMISANFNGTTSATVMIGTRKDNDAEEDYTITLGTSAGYTVGSDNTATGTITAVTPTLMLPTDPAAAVAGSDISLTITSDTLIAGTLMLPLTFSGQVAAADIDGGSPQMVSANFNSSTTATVTIGTVRDGDTDETYTIMLGSGAGYTVGSPNSVNGTITAATPELTLENNPVAITAGNDISLVVTSDISITRTLTLALGISGDVVASDITGGLTQNVTANFSGMTATVTIGTDMDSDSSAEDYTITLNAGTGYTVGTDPGDNTATGTINAAAATTPTLTLATNPADVAAGEDISLAITSDTVIASTLTVALTLGDEVAAEDITGGLSQMISANFNGTTSATVTIGTRKDNDAEEDYTITLATGTGYTVGSPNAVSGTITAVIPELTLATNPANVAAGEDISLAITSDTVIASTLTLPLTFSGEVAAEDITGGLSQMISANFNGTTSATVMIGTRKDNDAEEDYTITLGTSAGYTVGSDNTATGTITAVTPTLMLPTDPAAAVAGSDISLTITSDTLIAGTLMLPLTFSGQVAAADIDGGSPQMVSANFNSSTTATVTIGTVRDGDTDETYTIMLGSGAGYIVGSDNTADGTITAATPTLTLATDPSAVTAGSDISLLVTSDINVAGTLQVTLTISARGSNGVASPDFTNGLMPPAISVNFNGGTTATVTISTIEDGDSAAEGYRITLDNGSGYMPGTDNIADGTINPVPTLSLDDNPADVNAGESIALVITSDMAIAGNLMVSLTIRDRSSSGITAGDFTANTLTQTVTANFGGNTTATVMIATEKDSDSAETYSIDLNDAAGYSPLLSTVNGMINPAIPVLTLADDPAAAVAGENISLIITSDVAIASTLMVPLTFSGEVVAADIDGGSPQTVSANFGGNTTATVTIGTIRDGDPDETYTITLGSGTDYMVGSDSTADGTITAAIPELTLADDPVAVVAGGNISLTVTSDITIAGTLMLPLTFSGEVDAADIDGGSPQTFSANFGGNTTATVTIATLTDTDTSAETYTITLGTGSNYTVGSDNTATSTINAAVATTPTFTLADDPADVVAGNSIALTITSDIVVTGSLVVPLTFSGQVATGDFAAGLLTQTVTANFSGSRTATVMIATIKDGDAVETYTITLGMGTGYTVGGDNTAAGSITAATPELTLMNDPLAVVAGNSISLTVTSDITIAGTLTLPLTFSGQVVAADLGGNTLVQSVTADFNGNATATVMIATVKDGDPAETYTITLGTGSDYTVGSDPGDNTATGTINPAMPTLSLQSPLLSAVSAGDDISLPVTSDIDITGTLTVQLNIVDRSSGALTAADFTANNLSQAISVNFGGGKTGTATIGTAKDSDSVEESFSITLTSGTGYTVATSITSIGTITPATPTLTLATNPNAVSAGNDISLVVTSDIDVAGTLTVPLTISAGSPNGVASGDFTDGFSQTVNASFAGGRTAIVMIGTVRDADTMAETYMITLGANAGYMLGGDITATGTINAATTTTPTLTLPTDPGTVVAGNDISLSVTSNSAIAGSLMLSLTFSGQVTAADFTADSLTQLVSADFSGGRTATVTIATVRDTDGGETYTITLNAAAGYIPGGDRTATGTISAAPTPMLTLVTAPAAVTAGEDISLIVTSDTVISGTRTLSLFITAAAAGQMITAGDFTATSLSPLTPAVSANFNGSTTATVTIGTVKDADTTAENYTISLGNGTGYMAGSDRMIDGTINAALPTLMLATDPAAVVAGNNISLTVTSDVTVAGILTLPLTISDRAASGIVASDFSGGLTQNVSANFNGSTTATVTIATVEDGDAADETYTITLGNGTGYTVGTNAGDNTADGTINPVATLTLATDPAAVSAGSTISLIVTSNIDVAGTLTLPLMISDRAASGITGDDFTGGLTQSISADFAGGKTVTVMIATVKDGDVAETYTITLNDGDNYRVGSDNTADGTINPAVPTLTLADDPAPVSAGGDISLVVTSDIDIAGTLTLPVTISDRASSGITAGDFTDGFSQMGSANFAGGKTATVTIRTVEDSDTATETYTITLGMGAGYTVGSDNTANGAITPVPTLSLVTDPADVNAGESISLMVTSTIDIAGMVTLSLTISDRAASGITAGDFTDGLTQSVSANFAGGRTATVMIATAVDSDTAAETYTITLNDAGGYQVGSDNTAAGTITAILPTLTLETAPVTVTSGQSVSLVVTSDIAIAGTLMLPLTISDPFFTGLTAGQIVGGLTPTVSANFNGSRTATATIGTTEFSGLTETYRITLGSGTGYIVGGDNSEDFTVRPVPLLALETDPDAVNAGESISLVVSSVRNFTGTVALSLTISDRASSGIMAGDFTNGLTQTVDAIFTGGNTATVTIPTVRLGGATAKTYTITLNDSTGYRILSDNTADGTINPPIVTLTLETDPVAVTAGGDISLELTSDLAVAGMLPIRLTISPRGSNGVSGPDFTDGLQPSSINANFNGSRKATVTIGTVEDSDTAEDYTITLNNAAGYTPGADNTAEGTINPAPVLSLEDNPADVNAGESISLRVTSDTAIAGMVMVSLTISDRASSGITADDFTGGLTQSLRADFSGSTTATVMIATVKDTDSSAETYSIELNDAAGYSPQVGTVNGTINPAIPTLSLATDPAAVVAGGDISLVVTSDIAVAGTLMLPLTIADRAASGIAAGDFTNGLAQTISANFGGNTTATVTISTVEDGDAAETYTITLGSGTGYTVGSDSTADGTINPVPTLSLATDPADVNAGSSISLEISSDIVISGTLTLPLTISARGSSGVDADDFTGELARNVTANFGGTTSATIRIATRVDLDSSAETYRITLDDGDGYTPGTDNTADGTIDPFMATLELNSDAFGLTGAEGVTAGMSQLGVTLLSNYPDDLQLDTLTFTVTRSTRDLKRNDFSGGGRNNRLNYTIPNKSGTSTNTVITRNFDSNNRLTITVPSTQGILLSKARIGSSADMTFGTKADGRNEVETRERITVTLTAVTTTSGIPIQIDATKNTLTLTICDTLSQCP